jgi:hypothetical protein
MTGVERIRPDLRVQVRYYVGVKGLMADEVRVIGDVRKFLVAPACYLVQRFRNTDYMLRIPFCRDGS